MKIEAWTLFCQLEGIVKTVFLPEGSPAPVRCPSDPNQFPLPLTHPFSTSSVRRNERLDKGYTSGTITVSKNGSDMSGVDQPYLTIAAALAAASSDTLILISDGVYDEVSLTPPPGKSNIRIEGTSRANVMIKRTNCVVDTTLFTSNIPGFSLGNLTLELTTSTALTTLIGVHVTSDNASFTMENCTVKLSGSSSNMLFGLENSGTDMLTNPILAQITDCDFVLNVTNSLGSGRGIFTSSGTLFADACHVSVTGTTSDGVAVEVDGTGELSLTNSLLSGVTFDTKQSSLTAILKLSTTLLIHNTTSGVNVPLIQTISGATGPQGQTGSSVTVASSLTGPQGPTGVSLTGPSPLLITETQQDLPDEVIVLKTTDENFVGLPGSGGTSQWNLANPSASSARMFLSLSEDSEKVTVKAPIGNFQLVAGKNSSALLQYRSGKWSGSSSGSTNENLNWFPGVSSSASPLLPSVTTSNLGSTSTVLSLDGMTMAVGEPSSNRVFIYTRSSPTSTTWGSETILTFSGNTTDGYIIPGQSPLFGKSLALSADGTTLAVGAPRESFSASLSTSNAGAVFIFVLSAGIWTQQGSKITSFAGNNFTNLILPLTDTTVSSAMTVTVISTSIFTVGNTVYIGGGSGDVRVVSDIPSSTTMVLQSLSGLPLTSTYGPGTRISLKPDHLPESQFGFSVSLSADGNLLAAGTPNRPAQTSLRASPNATQTDLVESFLTQPASGTTVLNVTFAHQFAVGSPVVVGTTKTIVYAVNIAAQQITVKNTITAAAVGTRVVSTKGGYCYVLTSTAFAGSTGISCRMNQIVPASSKMTVGTEVVTTSSSLLSFVDSNIVFTPNLTQAWPAGTPVVVYVNKTTLSTAIIAGTSVIKVNSVNGIYPGNSIVMGSEVHVVSWVDTLRTEISIFPDEWRSTIVVNSAVHISSSPNTSGGSTGVSTAVSGNSMYLTSPLYAGDTVFNVNSTRWVSEGSEIFFNSDPHYVVSVDSSTSFSVESGVTMATLSGFAATTGTNVFVVTVTNPLIKILPGCTIYVPSANLFVVVAGVLGNLSFLSQTAFISTIAATTAYIKSYPVGTAISLPQVGGGNNHSHGGGSLAVSNQLTAGSSACNVGGVPATATSTASLTGGGTTLTFNGIFPIAAGIVYGRQYPGDFFVLSTPLEVHALGNLSTQVTTFPTTYITTAVTSLTTASFSVRLFTGFSTGNTVSVANNTFALTTAVTTTLTKVAGSITNEIIVGSPVVNTSGAALTNTTTVINLTNTYLFAVGQVLLVKVSASAAPERVTITAVGTSNSSVTVTPALSAIPSVGFSVVNLNIIFVNMNGLSASSVESMVIDGNIYSIATATVTSSIGAFIIFPALPSPLLPGTMIYKQKEIRNVMSMGSATNIFDMMIPIQNAYNPSYVEQVPSVLRLKNGTNTEDFTAFHSPLSTLGKTQSALGTLEALSGTSLTAAIAAGISTISVVSTAMFKTGSSIALGCEIFTVSNITNETTLVLSTGTTWSWPVGTPVMNYYGALTSSPISTLSKITFPAGKTITTTLNRSTNYNSFISVAASVGNTTITVSTAPGVFFSAGTQICIGGYDDFYTVTNFSGAILTIFPPLRFAYGVDSNLSTVETCLNNFPSLFLAATAGDLSVSVNAASNLSVGGVIKIGWETRTIISIDTATFIVSFSVPLQNSWALGTIVTSLMYSATLSGGSNGFPFILPGGLVHLRRASTTSGQQHSAFDGPYGVVGTTGLDSSTFGSVTIFGLLPTTTYTGGVNSSTMVPLISPPLAPTSLVDLPTAGSTTLTASYTAGAFLLTVASTAGIVAGQLIQVTGTSTTETTRVTDIYSATVLVILKLTNSYAIADTVAPLATISSSSTVFAAKLASITGIYKNGIITIKRPSPSIVQDTFFILNVIPSLNIVTLCGAMTDGITYSTLETGNVNKTTLASSPVHETKYNPTINVYGVHALNLLTNVGNYVTIENEKYYLSFFTDGRAMSLLNTNASGFAMTLDMGPNKIKKNYAAGTMISVAATTLPLTNNINFPAGINSLITLRNTGKNYLIQNYNAGTTTMRLLFTPLFTAGDRIVIIKKIWNTTASGLTIGNTVSYTEVVTISSVNTATNTITLSSGTIKEWRMGSYVEFFFSSKRGDEETFTAVATVGSMLSTITSSWFPTLILDGIITKSYSALNGFLLTPICTGGVITVSRNPSSGIWDQGSMGFTTHQNASQLVGNPQYGNFVSLSGAGNLLVAGGYNAPVSSGGAFSGPGKGALMISFQSGLNSFGSSIGKIKSTNFTGTTLLFNTSGLEYSSFGISPVVNYEGTRIVQVVIPAIQSQASSFSSSIPLRILSTQILNSAVLNGEPGADISVSTVTTNLALNSFQSDTLDGSFPSLAMSASGKTLLIGIPGPTGGFMVLTDDDQGFFKYEPQSFSWGNMVNLLDDPSAFSTTLTSPALQGTLSVTVADASGFSVNSFVRIEKSLVYTVQSISGNTLTFAPLQFTNVIPLTRTFPIGTKVTLFIPAGLGSSVALSGDGKVGVVASSTFSGGKGAIWTLY